MNTQMKEFKYDTSKLPLGILANNTIQKGYELLKQLSDAVFPNKPNIELSNQFYTCIPHDFGQR